MSAESQLEREEDHLAQMLADGRISNADYWKELRELHRDYRAAAQESAERAYQDEIERW